MKLEVKVPSVGESVSEATMGSWLKEDGEYVEQDEAICEIESEKATIEVNAEQAGVLHTKAQEGDTLSIGEVIAEIDTDADESQATKKEEDEEGQEAEKQQQEEKSAKEEQEEKEKEDEKEAEEEKGGRTKVSPVAERILQDAGIKPENVRGTGDGGKVTKSDALKAVDAKDKAEKESSEKKKETKEKPEPEPQKPDTMSGKRQEERVKMSTLRKTIARRLLEAKHGTAMLTTFNEIDMTNVVEVRRRYKEMFKEKHDIGLGFMSFFAKAASIALFEEPGVNAMIDGEEMVYHKYCDIGIAVSTEKGLVVPVIRNAESLSLAQIEKEVMRLATKARDGKLTIDEMSGGTFSITNGGVFGSLMATPIINAPQSAILGMHAINDRPVAIDGEVKIRPMMYIALSYDHRVIDGKESVTFLKRVKELVQDPMRMLLDV